MARAHVKDRVYEVLKARPNQHVTANEISRETGLTFAQARQGGYYLTRQHGYGVQKMATNVFMYHPGANGTAPKAPPVARTQERLFAQVGVARDGRILLQSEDGEIGYFEAL